MTLARTATTTATPAAAAGGPLDATRPRDDLDGLAQRLDAALARGDTLDAFLCAAGMLQIVEDALLGEPALLRHAARRLDDTDAPAARLAARAARAAGHRAGAVAERRLRDAARDWWAQLTILGDLLADALAGAPTPDPSAVVHRCAAVRDGVADLPGMLRTSAMRRPACFGTFDQHPDDVRELVRRFARARPARDRALLVVGVRTSGSYLAPLAGAFLRAQGYTDVHVMTLRPGRRLRADQRRLIRSVRQRRGVAVLCDDPPGTGATLAGVAAALAGRGLDVVLLLALFGTTPVLPRRLAHHAAVLLTQDEWSVTARMAPAAVGATAQRLLGPELEVIACRRLTEGGRRRVRGHVRAAYRLTLREPGSTDLRDWCAAVEGVGLGHLGADVPAIHQALAPFLAPVLGTDDGLLYREWLPDAARADRLDADTADVAGRLAAYVDARARALPLAADRTRGARGDRPAWEVASLVLSRAFGRAEPVARVLLVDPAVQRLLRVDRPSRVDGSMELSRWFAGPAGALVKVDWEDPAGSSRHADSCDPVSALAQVTARSQDRALTRSLREIAALLGGEPAGAERWLLHELAHLWSAERAAPGDPGPRRAAASAVRSYMHETFFADLAPPARGALCAIDVDGVLELSVLGFPALTPAAARGLRALIAHGHRPVLATGRSGPEVIERCDAYRLAGGVAEYGALVYVRGADAVRMLAGAEDAAAVARLRADLAALDGVRVDPRYRHVIRASRWDCRGGPRPLQDAEVAAALRRAGATSIRAIQGGGQTDLVPRRVDKGSGVRALAAALAPGGDAVPLAFAVGDGPPDIPVLRLADRAFVPAHAEPAVHAHGRTTRRPWTAGFAEAVGQLLGHEPGACPRCRVPAGDRDRRLMLALLGLRERGLGGLPVRALSLRRP